ncbi:RHS repeat-associated core domain-containing protein [Proteus sp. fly-1089]|uniref:RHS repeat-associated core domain-containing protein n=1 Tax=Proteus sp. fly-1089 TaxID=3136675 RepID=UPI0032DBA591
MEQFHQSQAFNFTSALTGHVDPRTGVFCTNITIAHLIGNQHMGPELSLTLSYSPLNFYNLLYVFGIVDNLTSYNKNSKILTLSTGQVYKVKEEKQESTFIHAKPKNFKFSKKGNELWVLYKSGVSEKLTSYNTADDVKVVREIYSPSGNKLTLEWEAFGDSFRLKSVRDNSSELFKATYSETLGRIQFDIWPETNESYSIILYKQDIFLSTVTIRALNTDLVWQLFYTRYGRSNIHKYLTKIITPTGLVEHVEYQTNGHRLPEGNQSYQVNSRSPIRVINKIPYIAYVKKHFVSPGLGTKKQIVEYDFSEKNFLGYGGASARITTNGQDYLYNVENNYQYDSIEKRKDTDKNITFATKRIYNSFHLVIEEREQTISHTNEILCEKITQITYYADINKSFEQQLPQYQMPKEYLIIWKQGDNYRREKSITEYDNECNIISMVAFDSTKSEFTYYDPSGESGKCPAEPNGFKKFIKEETITPATTEFETPTRKKQYLYDSFSIKNSQLLPVNNMVLLTSEIILSNNNQIRKQSISYYNDVSSDNLGRVLEKKVTITEQQVETLSLKEEYEWSYSNSDYISCIKKLTGIKDNIVVSTEKRWTPISYRLIMEKDTQGNISEYQYDKLGQLISNILSPKTPYENKIEYELNIALSNVPIEFSVKDALGNKYLSKMDGEGRIVEKFYFTEEIPNGFRIEKYDYNSLGKVISVTHYDLHNIDNPNEQPKENLILYKYNDWGDLIGEDYSNGFSNRKIFDPIKNQFRSQSISLRDVNKKSGIIQKEFNQSGKINKIVQLKSDGVTEEYYWQFFTDGLGRIRKTIDKSNNVTTFEYDDFDQLIEKKLPDGSIIKKKYKDSLPIQISLKPNDSNEMILGTQEFDSFGRLTRYQCGGRNLTMSYQGASPDPHQVTTADNSVISYEYISELDNAISSIKFNGEIQQYEYEPLTGRLIKYSENNGFNHLFSYTKSGQLKNEKITLQGKSERRVSYSYSLRNLLVSYTGVDNETQMYVYDKNNQITQIVDRAVTTTVNYNELGNYIGHKAIYNVNNSTLETKLTLDDFGRETKRELIEIRNNKTKNIDVEQTFLMTNKLSNKKLFLNKREIKNETYSYDNMGRLLNYLCKGEMFSKDSEGRNIKQQSYVWDALGNIKKSTTIFDNGNEVVDYHYQNSNDPCQLTHLSYSNNKPSITLNYDLNGRMIEDIFGYKLTYDKLGRLKTVINNKDTISYGYDGLNRLLTKEYKGGVGELYYRNDAIANEIYPNVNVRYNLLGKYCVGFKYDIKSNNDNTELYTEVATDMMGSAFAFFNTPDDPASFLSYSPWGDGAGAFSAGPRFTGELWDSFSQSYLLGNGYRAYQPRLMRFTCPDSLSPFGAGGLNAYAYCDGDPVNLSDPSGHISGWGWASIILGGVGLLLAPLTFGASLEFGLGVALALTALEVASGATAIAAGALEEKDPKSSEILGWVSLGLATPSIGLGIYSLGKGISKTASIFKNKPITLGGTMRKIDLLDQGFYTFEDTYKNASRLNIVSHGEPVGKGSLLTVLTEGGLRNMDADELYSILKTRYNLDDYASLRTLACHSGVGGIHSIGYKLGQLAQKDVKSFIGPMTGNFVLEDVFELFAEAVKIAGPAGHAKMAKTFSERHVFKIHKTNPYSIFDVFNYYSWTYQPTMFRY